MRYFFHIAYCGTQYRGWQRQANVISVQSVFEDSLFKIFKTKISTIGCGRTDAQVHASQYFIQADIPYEWDFDLLFRLNKALPIDISVFDIIPVDEKSNARFDAIERTYDYFIHAYKDPFLAEKSAYYDIGNLDIDPILKAISLIHTHTDFRAFCLCPDRHNTTICNIKSAQLFYDKSGDRLRFQITSNRFIRGMIRILISKFLEIGNKTMSYETFEHLFLTGERQKTLRPAHAQGLYLSKVTYPYIDIPSRTEFMAMMQGVEDWTAFN